ncbi:MAG: DUF2264 domain-containing protein [Candidatus Glassbacteria bacterium]|nr:DUF2264 domain-containing protein [Candidatus Glassbacteria bacterium]
MLTLLDRCPLQEPKLVCLALLIASCFYCDQILLSAEAGDRNRPQAQLQAGDDFELSPYTGYTREHWLEICEKLIAGVLPYFDEKTGMPTLTGTAGETGHFRRERHFVGGQKETFERSLMLVACYSAATGNDRVPGYDGSITEPYLTGIIRGTDPHDPAYWGEREIYDAFGTNIALAVLLSPKFFWDPLTDGQKNNLLEFLRVLAHTVAYDCNHWYFHLIAVPLLDANGVTSNREYLTMIFDRMLNWYRGDGWFIDGGNFTFDYYNLWGFQLYNNALCYFDGNWNERFGKRVAHTTARFLESFKYLYGRDGGPIPFGRSLSYRFASISALGWAVLNGTSTLPPGQARRIASGCLKYFWDNDCLSENGLLEPGFHGPNSVVAESYIDRGSPYWAAQGMICLAVPADHPFWTEEEEPMPADGAGGRLELPGAEMVLKVSPVDGEAKAYVLGEPVGHRGQWQRGIKYFQHSYSSYLGWCALGEGGPDLGAGRTGVSHDNKQWFFRTNPEAVSVDSHHSVSRYDFFLDTPENELEDFGQVITHTLIGEDGELHIFWHNSGRPLFLWLGGYGISVPDGEQPQVTHTKEAISISAGRYNSLIKILDGPPGILASDFLTPRDGWSHAHLFDGNGAYPYWKSAAPIKSNTVVAAYVAGSRDRRAVVPSIVIKQDTGALRIEFEGMEYTVPLPW